MNANEVQSASSFISDDILSRTSLFSFDSDEHSRVAEWWRRRRTRDATMMGDGCVSFERGVLATAAALLPGWAVNENALLPIGEFSVAASAAAVQRTPTDDGREDLMVGGAFVFYSWESHFKRDQ